MGKTVERIVGENVELVLRTESADGRIYVDPAGIEQVILNLVVNARDAMRPGAERQLDAVEAITQTDTFDGDETILLVEDDDQLRAVARGVLERRGYAVLTARDGGEALRIGGKHASTIHLLLTDVVMPRMSGPNLAARLVAIHPEMKVLCISGYVDDARVMVGMRFAYLQKPITPETLARKVREVLGARVHEGPPTHRE